MFLKALKEGLGFDRIAPWIRYKLAFKREHPLFFDPCGTCIFCGPQGSGKTLSAVNYVTNLRKLYPCCILCTNIQMRDYPFNAHLVQDRVVMDDSGIVVNSDEIVSGVLKGIPVTVEYSGLDALKFINNGEYGVIFLIDELHLELNSLESKNVDIDVMIEISQQRKQRKHIVGTSQIFMRLAKPVREQIKDIILCRNFFKCLQFNKLIDGETVVEENGKLKCDVKHRSFWFHSPEMYSRYDTFAKMKRYNQEWQGHSHAAVDFFAQPFNFGGGK